MRVEAAEYDRLGKRLSLSVPPADALKWLYSFKAGEYTITRTVKKRSLNANAYAWKLMGDIATVTGVPVEEVYRHSIENIGGVTDALAISAEALPAFRLAFIGDHIGRKVEVIGRSSNMVDILITYGSSDYNVQQMCQLIDSITQDCHALGIPTLEDEKLQQIIDDWEARHEK